MCPQVPLFFEDDDLRAAFYEAMAQVSRAVLGLKEKNISLPVKLWKTERNLRDFVASVNTRKPTFTQVSIASAKDSIQKLRELHESIEGLLLTAKRKGLTNNRFYGGSLRGMRDHSEQILDMAENLELLIDPRTRESLDRARKEHSEGSTVRFESLSL